MYRQGIVFSGSGGQGVITASIILAEAAVIHEGINAVQAQSYGPEARGGATRADVILSDEVIHYPKVIKPNVLITLTQLAFNKYSHIVRPGGLVITDRHFVKDKEKLDARSKDLDIYKRVMQEIGRPVVFNIAVLGALVGLVDLVRPESIMKVLEKRIPPDFLDLNRRALELGLALAAEKKS